jgi:NTP pyrophosphatase (non-canonical NTP hydrolase)
MSKNILEKYSEFQQNTQKKQFDIKYMALGLGGEVGEVQNNIKKLERDDNNQLKEDRRNKIITELGNTMWYFTGICNQIGCSLQEVLENNMEKLSQRNQ